jgi:hypothetical protein
MSAKGNKGVKKAHAKAQREEREQKTKQTETLREANEGLSTFKRPDSKLLPYPSLPSVRNLLLLWSVQLGENLRHLVVEYTVFVSALTSC